MGKKSSVLYVASGGWLAHTERQDPLAGSHDDACGVDWKGVGEALHALAGSRQVRVLLSARLCRFGVLPWVSSLASRRAMHAYVAEALAEDHGISAQSHHLAIDWPAFGEPVLAAAYPRALVEAVREGLEAAGHVLDVVESTPGPVLRRYGARLGAGPALLAWAEEDGIAAVTVEDNRVAQIETLPRNGQGLDDLAVWSARKQFIFADDASLHWLATAEKPVAFPGATLDVAEATPAVSAGHALGMAWR